jgi:hypothetical protein
MRFLIHIASPIPMNDSSAMPYPDFKRSISRSGINDHDLIAPRKTREAAIHIRRLVFAHDEGGNS